MKCQIQFVLQYASVLQIEIEHKYECMYKVFNASVQLTMQSGCLAMWNQNNMGFSELGILFQICAKVFKLIVV